MVLDLISTLNLTGVRVLKGVFPEETGGVLADSLFRLCHIDVDVYQSAKDILEWIWPRMIPGASIVFDDYGFRGCEGITSLVNEERKRAGRMVVYNLNGHAIIFKTDSSARG